MNMKAIVNTNIVMEDHIILDGVILFDETIIEIKEKDNLEIPQNAEIIDARGNYTTPGFIDIHNHGCDGMWMFEKPKEVSAHFLEHGTTTTLCNIFYNMDLEGYLRGIETIRSFLKSEGPHTIIGFYMEGPYMNSKYGADSKNNKWNHPISEDEYRKLVDSAGDLVKVWCIAPEREGIEEFCRYAREVNPDVLFSVGHSEAKPDMIYKLKKYGLRNQTHIMNATGIVNPLCAENKPCGIRDCGPDEAVLYDNDIYAEMIVDKLGIHLKPHNIRMILKTKGFDRTILVTDSYPIGFAPPKGDFEKATDLGFDSEGGLCGSKMSMDMACRNMFQHTGIGLSHIFKLASLNPAKLLGIEDKVGSIEIGKYANLLIIDDKFNIDRVILKGQMQ